MDVEIEKKKSVIEIIIEKDFAESAKYYYEKTKELYVLSGPNPFLSLELIDKGSVNGVPNTADFLERGDVVRGFFDKDTYWKGAYYLGGDPTLITSWQPIEAAVSSPDIPDIPNPNPPVDPPPVGTRNFSTEFLAPNFKIYS